MTKVLEIGSRVQVLTNFGRKRGEVVDIRTIGDLKRDFGDFEHLPEVGRFDNAMIQVKIDGRKIAIFIPESSIIKIL